MSFFSGLLHCYVGFLVQHYGIDCHKGAVTEEDQKKFEEKSEEEEREREREGGKGPYLFCFGYGYSSGKLEN